MTLTPKPLRFGLIGAAKISPHAVIAPARRTGLAEIVAIAARDKNRAAAYAAAHGIPGVADSYDALIARPDIDIVYNALPPSLHAQVSIAALKAGKHVLCEKPLCVTLDEARAMAAAAAAGGVMLVESMHYRYHPQIDRALDLVAIGAIGALQKIDVAFSVTIPRAPNDIRWKPELGGGALLDIGTYCLHLCRTFGRGEPEVISAKGRFAADGLDEAFTASLKFENGVAADIACDLEGERRRSLSLIGTRGTLTLPNPIAPQSRDAAIILNGHIEPVSYEPTFTYQMQALVQAIHSGRQPLTGASDCVANFELIDKVRQAMAR